MEKIIYLKLILIIYLLFPFVITCQQPQNRSLEFVLSSPQRRGIFVPHGGSRRMHERYHNRRNENEHNANASNSISFSQLEKYAIVASTVFLIFM